MGAGGSCRTCPSSHQGPQTRGAGPPDALGLEATLTGKGSFSSLGLMQRTWWRASWRSESVSMSRCRGGAGTGRQGGAVFLLLASRGEESRTSRSTPRLGVGSCQCYLSLHYCFAQGQGRPRGPGGVSSSDAAGLLGPAPRPTSATGSTKHLRAETSWAFHSAP